MNPQEIELILAPSEEDAPPFSTEFQSELRGYARKVNAPQQRSFAMDSIGAVGGPIGEFIFSQTGAVLAAISAVGVAWVTGRAGRKLRVKFKDIEIEARNAKEVESMLNLIRDFEAKSESLQEKLERFDPTVHGGESMSGAPVGNEIFWKP